MRSFAEKPTDNLASISFCTELEANRGVSAVRRTSRSRNCRNRPPIIVCMLEPREVNQLKILNQAASIATVLITKKNCLGIFAASMRVMSAMTGNSPFRLCSGALFLWPVNSFQFWSNYHLELSVSREHC